MSVHQQALLAELSQAIQVAMVPCTSTSSWPVPVCNQSRNMDHVMVHQPMSIVSRRFTSKAATGHRDGRGLSCLVHPPPAPELADFNLQPQLRNINSRTAKIKNMSPRMHCFAEPGESLVRSLSHRGLFAMYQPMSVVSASSKSNSVTGHSDGAGCPALHAHMQGPELPSFCVQTPRT